MSSILGDAAAIGVVRPALQTSYRLEIDGMEKVI